MNLFIARLKEAFGFCVKFKVPVLIGAVVFALLTTAVQIGVKSNVGLPAGSLEDVGTRLEDLSGKIEEGDPAAIDEAMGELGMIAKDGQASPTATMFTLQVAVTLGVAALVMVLLFLIMNAYFLILPIEKISSAATAFKRALRVFLPLLGVGIWVMLRSFIWIPVIGLWVMPISFVLIPVIGIFFCFCYALRMIFAGVIYLKEKKGISESVRVSIERTKGKWLVIVLNFVGLAVVTFVSMAIISSVLVLTGPASLFLDNVVSNLFIAFWSAFTVIYAGQIGTPAPVVSHETPQV